MTCFERSKRAPLRVLLLSDGRPGHFRLSEGVIAAINRRRETAVTWLPVHNRLRLPKAAVPKLARRLPPRTTLQYLHGLRIEEIAEADLIVSAGAMTLGANAAISQLTGTPNIFCGTTRKFDLGLFRLILSDDSIEGGPPNVRIGPKPATFDPEALPPPQTITADGPCGSQRPLHLGVLVGAPTSGAPYSQEDWERLSALLRTCVTSLGWRITIVTSPRTTDAVYEALGTLDDLSGDTVTLWDFRQTGPGTTPEALGADIVLVTSDSMNMMTEAALSRRPAIALLPERVFPTRDERAINWLLDQGWLAMIETKAATPALILETAARLTPMTTNHLDLLADHLAVLID